MKLKYALPLAQVMLAVSLYSWSDAWFRASRHAGTAGPSAGFTLLIAINAPLALPRALWFRHTSEFADRVILIASIGLLWHWMALNIDSWRRRKTIVMFSWAPLRLVGDLVLVLLGLFWGLMCLSPGPYGVRRTFSLSSSFGLSWSRTALFLAVELILLSWSSGLIYFFGRDFIYCIRSKTGAG